jgi:hypothetical protein
VDWITDRIAIGDYREAQDVELLRRCGFGSILGLIGTLAGRSLTELGVRQVEIVTLLDGAGNDMSRFRRAVDALARLAEEVPPVLVHCRAGWSRSPAVVAGYLMRSLGLTADEALAQVLAKRRSGDTVPELRSLLAEFEKASA